MAASGYDSNFIDPVSDYECPLCLHITREPTLTSCCGQHFCQVCINIIITDHKPCPFCKRTGFTVLLDKKQKRRVLELKVQCTMKERGCKWTGELGVLDTHLDTTTGDCDFVDVNCPKNCGKALQKRFLKKHLAIACPKRDFSCKYCGFKATHDQIHDIHMPECPKYPLECPNKCEIGKVKRGCLEAHISECPLQELECEFSQMGCDVKTQRKNMAKHMEEAMQSHLLLVTHFSMTTSKQLAESQKSTGDTQTELAGTQKQLFETRNELDDSHKKLDETRKQLGDAQITTRDMQERLAKAERRIADMWHVLFIAGVTNTKSYTVPNW